MAAVGLNGVLSECVRTGFLANTEAEITICFVSKMRRHKSAGVLQYRRTQAYDTYISVAPAPSSELSYQATVSES